MEERFELLTVHAAAGSCFDGPVAYRVYWYPGVMLRVATGLMWSVTQRLNDSSVESANRAFDSCCRFIREEISRRGRQVAQVVVSENWDYSLCPAVYDFGVPIEHPESEEVILTWEDTH